MPASILRPVAFAALLLSSSLAGAAWADPPQRVGRLGYIEGTVSQHRADEPQWSAAMLNYPVTSGASFWTEPAAKAEIQVGSAEIRMDASTELDVTSLEYGATVIQLPQGDINVHLRAPQSTPIQVLTPLGEVDLSQPGSYHIDAGHPGEEAPAPRAALTVLEGEAQIKGPDAPLPIAAGEMAIISGNPPGVALAIGDATPFDNWALLRERREAAAGVRYVSPEMTGVADMEQYGSWNTLPTYGAVWYPAQVASDWAPYRYGHWAYVAPWGWTWVDDAPWGFAPFHYGRWIQAGGRWGWCPGHITRQPVYAPALVAFLGGAGWSVAGGIHAVGWVPLAPSEPFHPYYDASDDYRHEVNSADIGNAARNRQGKGKGKHGGASFSLYANNQAATVMNFSAFAKGAPVKSAFIAAPRTQLAVAPVAANLAHITPEQSALRGGGQKNIDAQHVPHPAGEAVPHNVTPPRPGFAPSSRTRPVALPFASHAQSIGAHNLEMPGVDAQSHPAVRPVPVPGVIPGPAIRHEMLHPALLQARKEETQAKPQAHPAPAHVSAVVAASPVVAFHRPPTPPAAPEVRQPAEPPHDNHAAGWPQAEARHPAQQSHIAPTPQGWVRSKPETAHPAPPKPHPQAPHPASPHGVQQQDEHNHP